VPPLRLLLVVLALLVSVGGPARAQDSSADNRPRLLPAATADPSDAGTDASGQPEVSTHTGFHSLLSDMIGDFRALPSRENLGWTIFGGGVALSVHPIDGATNEELHGKAAVNNFFLPGKTIGNGYVQVAGAIGTYAAGRLSHEPKIAHVGMDLLRAQLLAGAMTFGLKSLVRRERPDGSNNRSFPSGHAALTFATATALQRHVGWDWSLPLFFIASYTAASRLHENVHYLSDVVFGASVGVIAGRTVTRHGRSSYALVPIWSHGVAAVMVQRTF
jgi:membrane-associated phospholipid phosphatase